MNIVNPEVLDFKTLKISGKKILFNCEFQVQKKEMGLEATGILKVGPLKGNVSLASSWSEDLKWTSFTIRAPKLNFYQLYTLHENKILFESSKTVGTQIIETKSCERAYDPLQTLLKIREDYCCEDIQKSYWTFSGAKVCELQSQGTTILRDKKEVFQISGTKKNLIISLIPIRTRLSVEVQL